jgi:hypothetical protein
VLADCPSHYARGQEKSSPSSKPAEFASPIPYEWYQPPLAERLSKDAPARLVLVLWLRVEEFCERPFEQLLALRKLLPYDKTTWRIIGPYGSSGLRTLVNEVSANDARKDKKALRFYSPYATVPDSKLLEGIPKEARPKLEKFLDDKGVSLVRTIGNDGQLANALTEELVLRGLKAGELTGKSDAERVAACRTDPEHAKQAPSRVAILAERDTFYGRNVLNDFSDGTSSRGFCAEGFDYLRGLDGELPVIGSSPQGSSGAPKASQSSSKTEGGGATFEEIAAGQQQFDYLRRLSLRLRERDRELRSASQDNRGGVRAIGVLGSDVHDKLLILQALKPEFPDAVFFTTDLDSRFLHPREQPWARNLVVASTFGLRLGDEFQGGTPPFRDSYQTAIYLSTLLAISDTRAVGAKQGTEITQGQIDAWFTRPRIFEIGRTMAFDFTNDGSADTGDCRWVLAGCGNIHPPSSSLFPRPAFWRLAFIFAICVLCLWLAPLTISRDRREKIFGAPSGTSPYFRNAAIVITVIALQFGLPLWMAAVWPNLAPTLTRNGSPLVALEGISTWPTETIRLFIILLSIYLMLRSRVKLAENLDEIGKRLGLGGTRSQVLAGAAGAEAKPPVETGPLRFWRDYVRRNSFRAQFARTAILTGIVFLAGYALVAVLGEGRAAPIRGDMPRFVHNALQMILLFMMCFVVLFVAQVVVSCIAFVKRLPAVIAEWQEPDLQLFTERIGLTGELLRIWVELQLIALRTKAVLGLIYFPFIIPSLMMLSTGGFLSASRIPLGPVVLALVGATIAVVCGWRLNASAEASRSRAIQMIDEALMRVHTAKQGTAPEGLSPTALNQFRNAILDLHEGAFAPFWEQTMIYALLIPFAAIGSNVWITSWLDRLMRGT